MNRLGIIIGAMKCGTSSLFRYLGAHPEVAASKHKEPNFFGKDTRWARGFGWYRELFDWDPEVHRIGLEASTYYTKLPRFPAVAARMANLRRTERIDLRLIYLVRDPISRIESHYANALTAGWISDRVAREVLASGCIPDPLDPEIVAISRYVKQLDAYRRFFAREDLLVLALDDLKMHPVRTIRQVCRFLGINHQEKLAGLHRAHNQRSARALYPRWLMRARRLPAVRAMARALPRRLHHRARKIVSRELGRGPRLSDAQRQRVARELRGDLERLELEYGVDVSGWCSAAG